MGIVVRQSIKTTLVTLFGAVLGAIIVLVSTYLLPVQYYGFIKYMMNINQLLSIMTWIQILIFCFNILNQKNY